MFLLLKEMLALMLLLGPFPIHYEDINQNSFPPMVIHSYDYTENPTRLIIHDPSGVRLLYTLTLICGSDFVFHNHLYLQGVIWEILLQEQISLFFKKTYA